MAALPQRRKAVTVPDELVSIDLESAIYRDGSYLKNNASWHIDGIAFQGEADSTNA
jgi:hypothetical protein